MSIDRRSFTKAKPSPCYMLGTSTRLCPVCGEELAGEMRQRIHLKNHVKAGEMTEQQRVDALMGKLQGGDDNDPQINF